MSEFFGPLPGARPGTEQAFTDVLNGLALGGRQRKHRRSEHRWPGPSQPDPAPPLSELVPEPEPHWQWPVFTPEEPAERETAHPGGESVAHQRWDRFDADPAFAVDAAIVRPYSWTGGRTKSTVELRIETMVSVSERGRDVGSLIAVEHRSVARLCLEPRSVAEVATLLDVPLGVAKVLLGDMAKLGLVVVHRTAVGGANKAHLMLMERVLSGLRRL